MNNEPPRLIANALDRFTDDMTPQSVSNDGRAPSASRERRVAAVLEIVGVFVVGTLLARLASRGLNLGPVNLRALAPGEEPDFLALSRSTAANLLLRYGFVLGLAFVVGWWHRRRRLADYGVTTAGCRVRDHVIIAALLFAAAGLPPLGLKFLADVLPLGQAPQHWALTQALDRPGIWMYLFVGSFGLVPIVEELFARGYVQSRLAEDFGAPAAILMTALFFTFSHTQYFIGGVLGVGMLASLFVASVAGGYVRYRTGSLLPGTVAHALGNLPFRGWVVPAVLALMALLVVIWWRPVVRYANGLWHEVVIRDAVVAVGQATVVLIVLLAQVMFAPRLLPGSAALALTVALLVEFREKRSALQPTGA
jgi:membrane protease YdiL (CAAX protease family)